MNDRGKDPTHVQKIGVRNELRLKVLRALELNPDLSQRQLAAELGVSLGGVNYAIMVVFICQRYPSASPATLVSNFSACLFSGSGLIQF